jgi:hypothetical protein
MSVETSMDSLDEVLEAEREALLRGDLEKLAEMVETKEALIARLNEIMGNDLPRLRELDVKVRRNQQLLDGALEGIRAVARRMAELRRIRGSLETYGSDGKKRNIEVEADRSIEKRA